MDATPIPSPPMILKEMSVVVPDAAMQPIEETRKNRAARSITFLRPYRSLKVPAAATPMMQPNRAQLTNQPSMAVSNRNWFTTKESTPDITAVSKPNRKPPIAATKLTRKRYLLCPGVWLLGIGQSCLLLFYFTKAFITFWFSDRYVL
ncbi:hypothetical protein D9M68_883470 [compost metagenome]